MPTISVVCYNCGLVQAIYEDPDSDRGMFCICRHCAGIGPTLSRETPKWAQIKGGKNRHRRDKIE